MPRSYNPERKSTNFVPDEVISRDPEGINDKDIDKLVYVVRTGKFARDLIFIGWDANGNPTISRDAAKLSSQAREVYEVYRRGVAGYVIPTVSFSDLIARKFNYLDRLIDSPSGREDLFVLSTSSEKDNKAIVKVGEQEILEAIAAANNPLLDTEAETIRINRQIVKPEELYCLILRGYSASVPDNTGVALLFKPAMEGIPQEATFRVFVEEVVGNLVANDLEQNSNSRKGYAQVAATYLGRDTSKEAPTNPLARIFYRSKRDQDEAGKSLHQLFYGDKTEDQVGLELDLNKLQSLERPTLFGLVSELNRAAKQYFYSRS